MITLSNLKLNQTKTVGDTTVYKDAGTYLVTHQGHEGIISFSKENGWTLTTGGAVFILDGATAKTAVTLAAEILNTGYTAPVELVEEDEAAAAPSAELAVIEPAGEVELAAEVVEAELVDEESEEDESDTPTQLDYDVDTKGGHSPHRLTALATIANAAGATVDKHVVGGWNGSVTLTALVPASQVDQLTDILQRFEAAVEPLAAVISKAVSNQARSEGRHHSGPGCHARRGFIRGFGDAVAGKINPEAELEGDFGQNLKYDHDAYLAGLMAGESFQVA